jgi:hypothetical protein
MVSYFSALPLFPASVSSFFSCSCSIERLQRRYHLDRAAQLAAADDFFFFFRSAVQQRSSFLPSADVQKVSMKADGLKVPSRPGIGLFYRMCAQESFAAITTSVYPIRSRKFLFSVELGLTNFMAPADGPLDLKTKDQMTDIPGTFFVRANACIPIAAFSPHE